MSGNNDRHDTSTITPGITAEDKRLYTAVGVAAAVAVLVVGCVWVAVDLVSLAHGGPATVGVRHLLPTAAQHQTAVTAVAFIVFALVGFPLTLGGIWAAKRLAPNAAGHATRAEIKAELSENRARQTAVWTRPGMSEKDRRHCPVTEVAVPLHADEHRRPLWLPLENPTGVIAPTQSGKSRRDLTHKILAAPGGMLVSTTKPELFLWTAMGRVRRGVPVLLFDVTGAVDWPAQVRWSPIDGCEDPTQAMRRAKALVDAAAVDLGTVSGGNEKTFRTRAYGVIRSYLVAAAISGEQVGALVDWAASMDEVPVRILDEKFPQLATNLRAELKMVPETRDAVWMSVRKAIEPFLQDRIQALCSPPRGAGFDAEAFIRSGGALYLIAGEKSAADVAPVLTALVDYVITTARDMAARSAEERMDPVFSVFLDELPTATPVPDLPQTCADSAGRGVLIHWVAQSRAQLEQTYGHEGARSLIDNSAALVAFGGIKDEKTLEWLAKLCGDHDVTRKSRSSGGLFSGSGQTTTSLQRLPKYQAATIREIPRDRALIIFRHMAPILARTTDVSERPDAKALLADRATLREAEPIVDASGYPLQRREDTLQVGFRDEEELSRELIATPEPVELVGEPSWLRKDAQVIDLPRRRR
jgi:type IV secretory pathway TraG/TraD family ATPase VirD4